MVSKTLILGSSSGASAEFQEVLKGRAFKARRKTSQRIRGFSR